MALKVYLHFWKGYASHVFIFLHVGTSFLKNGFVLPLVRFSSEEHQSNGVCAQVIAHRFTVFLLLLHVLLEYSHSREATGRYTLPSFLKRDITVWYRVKDKIMTVAMLILAADLNPGGLIMWLIVGLVAGFFASRVMRGGGYGLIGDIVVGIVGAFLGGWLAGFLGFGATYGLFGSIVIAFIGACILLALLHAVSGRRLRA